jgi:hypothetical protein
MKISELIERLEKIRLEYGNLEVWLEVYTERYDDPAILDSSVLGELEDMFTEERRVLYLVAEEY